jgi:hypothetical protein
MIDIIEYSLSLIFLYIIKGIWFVLPGQRFAAGFLQIPLHDGL